AAATHQEAISAGQCQDQCQYSDRSQNHPSRLIRSSRCTVLPLHTSQSNSHRNQRRNIRIRFLPRPIPRSVILRPRLLSAINGCVKSLIVTVVKFPLHNKVIKHTTRALIVSETNQLHPSTITLPRWQQGLRIRPRNSHHSSGPPLIPKLPHPGTNPRRTHTVLNNLNMHP